MITACQRLTKLTLAGGLLATLWLTALPVAAVEAPEAVKAAIVASFPGATIKAVQRERERKVTYYEVEIAWKDQELEVEVAPDGALGEVTQELKEADLPAEIAAKIKALVGTGKLNEVERTEVRGVPRGNTFKPQSPPKIVYEITYTDAPKKKTVEARLGADGAVIASADDDNADDADDAEDDDEGENEHGHQDRK
jgi:hypothetical protein